MDSMIIEKNNENYMEDSKLQYSKKKVQKAGEILIINDIINKDPEKYENSMEILSNWRYSHFSSLSSVYLILEKASYNIDRRANIVKRLKRAPSIIKKLQRFNKMKLRNMQDIAGCRAILSTTKNVYKVKRELNKNRTFAVTDYINSPKDDGYRGIHLIGKYENQGVNYVVEIQLRSKIQHAWATAVEIVDLFTNQTLKSNEGKQEWLDFFKYISNEFSKLEDKDNQDIPESLEKSMLLLKKLDVYKKFDTFANSLEIIEKQVQVEPNNYFLLKMNLEKGNKTINVLSYPSNSSCMIENYLKFEKEAAINSDLVIALVSSESINNLKEAYPNYFANSKLFLNNLKIVEAKYENKFFQRLSRFLYSSGFRG